ncbi:MAG: aminomethyl-transferring glycine dehydrogenase subunit GcvPB, partial [Vulcanimicrobiaceae bacterium]
MPSRLPETLIFETGRPGRANNYFANGRATGELLATEHLRADLPLPDNSELDVVRHFTRLSQ